MYRIAIGLHCAADRIELLPQWMIWAVRSCHFAVDSAHA